MIQEGPSEFDPRYSMWSIFSRLWVIYFTLFTALYIAGLSYVIWYESVQQPGLSAFGLINVAVLKQAEVGAGAAITSFAITEGGRLTMVIAKLIDMHVVEPRRQRLLKRFREEARKEVREEVREKVREEAREEGRSQAASKVQEWNRRRLEAEARGEHFDEPLPDLTQP